MWQETKSNNSPGHPPPPIHVAHRHGQLAWISKVAPPLRALETARGGTASVLHPNRTPGAGPHPPFVSVWTRRRAPSIYRFDMTEPRPSEEVPGLKASPRMRAEGYAGPVTGCFGLACRLCIRRTRDYLAPQAPRTRVEAQVYVRSMPGT